MMLRQIRFGSVCSTRASGGSSPGVRSGVPAMEPPGVAAMPATVRPPAGVSPARGVAPASQQQCFTMRHASCMNHQGNAANGDLWVGESIKSPESAWGVAGMILRGVMPPKSLLAMSALSPPISGVCVLLIFCKARSRWWTTGQALPMSCRTGADTKQGQAGELLTLWQVQVTCELGVPADLLPQPGCDRAQTCPLPAASASASQTCHNASGSLKFSSNDIMHILHCAAILCRSHVSGKLNTGQTGSRAFARTAAASHIRPAGGGRPRCRRPRPRPALATRRPAQSPPALPR